MHFRIITRPDCIYCDQAKTYLTLLGHSYSEDLRDTPTLRGDFRRAGFTLFPQIWEGQTHIGGFRDLKRYLEENDEIPVRTSRIPSLSAL